MRITFYDTRIGDDDSTILVKEKAVNYGSESPDTPEKIARMMNQLLDMNKLAEEHCYMLAMNSACRILGIFFLAKGTVSLAPISSREIFLRALLIGASQFILCHNHPSQNTSPSKSDLHLTEQIKNTGDLIGIRLADHIIIGGGGFFSFKGSALL